MSEPRGLYFEDYTDGMDIVSAGRTITETDIVQFASSPATGTSSTATPSSPRPRPLASASPTACWACPSPPAWAAPWASSRARPSPSWACSWKFAKPIFIGDTIRLRVKLNKKRAVSAEAGMVVIDADILNQRDEVTQKGEWTVMVKRRTV